MKVVIEGVEYVPRPDLGGSQRWADKIKKVRQARKDTLESMARRTGLSKTYLWQLESTDSIMPSLPTIRALLRYAGMTFEELFGME